MRYGRSWCRRLQHPTYEPITIEKHPPLFQALLRLLNTHGSEIALLSPSSTLEVGRGGGGVYARVRGKDEWVSCGETQSKGWDES